MKKNIPIEQAIGMVLPHDITEIVSGEKKGAAFKKGHVIKEDDLDILRRIGKNNIYALTLNNDELHENDAAIMMAKAIAGVNIIYDPNPSEGKINFQSALKGLLKVDRQGLKEFNMLGDVMLATLHGDIPVEKNQNVGGCRAIPLVVSKDIIEKAVSIAQSRNSLLSVKPYIIKKGAIIVTGREVYEGRIKDAFKPLMRKKYQDFGIATVYEDILPDDTVMIKNSILKAFDNGAEIIICTGGMSVDPDDVTRHGIALAGAINAIYGSPVLPGAMFLVGYIENVPVLGVPACGMYFKTTALDLILPRVIAGEKLTREDIAEIGYGGFCMGCRTCNYPVCPFGKS